MVRRMAKDKAPNDNGAKPKHARMLGPATIARPARFGAATLLVVRVATKG